MSKTWKWILGIVIGLVVLASIGFMAARYFGFGHMAYFGRTSYSGHPMMEDYGFGNRGPQGGNENFRHPMMGDYGFGNRVPEGGYQNFRHPMMGGRGFYPLGGFFFLAGLLRLVFPLAILAAVGYFSYRAGKKAGMNTALPVPAPEPVKDAEAEESPKKGGRKVA